MLALVGEAARVERADLDQPGVVAECLAVAPSGARKISLLFEAACHGNHRVRRTFDKFLGLVEGIAGVVVSADRGKEPDAAGVRLVAFAVERHGLLHERQRGGGVAFQLIDGGGGEQGLRGVRVQFVAAEVLLAGFLRAVGLLQQASKVKVPVRSVGIAGQRLAEGSLGFGQPAVLVVTTGLLGQFVSVTPFAVRVCHDGGIVALPRGKSPSAAKVPRVSPCRGRVAGRRRPMGVRERPEPCGPRLPAGADCGCLSRPRACSVGCRGRGA